MNIELDPKIEALVRAQVKAGKFKTVEDAVTAAILGAPLIDDDALEHLTWARPYLEEAEKAIAEGRTFSEEETYTELEKRLGKI